MQDDEEFSRKYTHEELENAKELARNLYSTTDAASIGKFVDLSSRQAEVMQDVITKLAAVTAQRDELLQTVKAVQTMCHGAIRVRIDGIIAKCEVQNG